MTRPAADPPATLTLNQKRMLKILRSAVRGAILDHKRNGDPIVIWRDGKVDWLPADEIEVDDLEKDEGETDPL